MKKFPHLAGRDGSGEFDDEEMEDHMWAEVMAHQNAEVRKKNEQRSKNEFYDHNYDDADYSDEDYNDLEKGGNRNSDRRGSN